MSKRSSLVLVAIALLAIGDQIPENFRGGNGPENLKAKSDIIRFLKDSFALGHKAAATLTTENMLQPAEHSKSSRLHFATFAVEHAYDHYGQMVEYLRMNGIVPPAGQSQIELSPVGFNRMLPPHAQGSFSTVRVEPFWLGREKVSFLSRKPGEPDACILTA